MYTMNSISGLRTTHDLENPSKQHALSQEQKVQRGRRLGRLGRLGRLRRLGRAGRLGGLGRRWWLGAARAAERDYQFDRLILRMSANEPRDEPVAFNRQ